MKQDVSVGYRYPFAYVAFGGRKTRWWMRFLKQGFYHCALILGNGHEWILIDPLVHFTDLIILKHTPLKEIMQDKGYRLIQTTPVIPPVTNTQFRPFTCVETVKRFLGINSLKIWTPYQLFRFLSQKRKIILDISKKM